MNAALVALTITIAAPAPQAGAPGPVAASPGAAPLATAVRGIAGAVEFDAPGPTIRANAAQSLDWPLIARIARADPGTDGLAHYRVEFLGSLAGDFDLRPCLERQDGSALRLDPVVVRVVSQLPPDHGTDLFSSAHALGLSPSRYRLLLIGAGVAWASVPLAFLAARALRRRPAPTAAPPPPAPTLADQLRPLVQGAVSGSLSVAERGRLELLLYLYWRGRLALEGPQAAVVSRLRDDAQAGALLRAVERWLHAARAPAGRADGDVAALLEPYRLAPAIAEPDGAAAGAEGGPA